MLYGEDARFWLRLLLGCTSSKLTDVRVCAIVHTVSKFVKATLYFNLYLMANLYFNYVLNASASACHLGCCSKGSLEMSFLQLSVDVRKWPLQQIRSTLLVFQHYRMCHVQFLKSKRWINQAADYMDIYISSQITQ